MADEIKLSDDAKAIAGGFFALTTTLNFGMTESKPTARMQAALDELLAAKLIYSEPVSTGGISYRACGDMEPYRKWFRRNMDHPSISFPIVEPITPAGRAELEEAAVIAARMELSLRKAREVREADAKAGFAKEAYAALTASPFVEK